MAKSHSNESLSFFEEINAQLDILNQMSTRINDLENELENARNTYHKLLDDHLNKTKKLKRKLNKYITVCRPYFELQHTQSRLLEEIQLTAAKYDETSSVVNLVRENLAKLEDIILCHGSKDTNCLETINHHTMKFNDSNRGLSQLKAEHERLLETYITNEKELSEMEKHHRFDITRSKPYFLMCNQFNQSMQETKIRIESYNEKLRQCKISYAEAMSKLEKLSDSVHMRRATYPGQQDPQTVGTLLHKFTTNGIPEIKFRKITRKPLLRTQSLKYCHFDQLSSESETLSKSESQLNNITLKLGENHSNADEYSLVNELLEYLHRTSLEVDQFQNRHFNQNALCHPIMESCEHSSSSVVSFTQNDSTHSRSSLSASPISSFGDSHDRGTHSIKTTLTISDICK